MSHTPFARAESLRIGTIDYIAPDEARALLDIDAPESVALNTESLRPFPRVNAYVLMPVEDGYLVGQVEWLTIERSPFPKRRGVQDFGLIDLPYPLRRMRINPLGMLRGTGVPERFAFSRGAHSLPSVGTPVLLPTESQLRCVVESGDRRRVRIGVSPLAGNAEVRVDPDRLFGRHLAVLGNTGSGKSCTVAGLIRWALAAARTQRASGDPPNARFIVLDPNGEYARAFATSDTGLPSRIFRVSPDKARGERPLRVPLWFWNSDEWASFAQASARAQRPLLKRALREVKAGRFGAIGESGEEQKLRLRRELSSILLTIRRDETSGAIKTEETKFGYRLKAMREDVLTATTQFPDLELVAITSAIEAVLTATYNEFQKDGKTISFYRAFTKAQIATVTSALQNALTGLGGIIYQAGPDEDMPVPFKGVDLADHLQTLAGQENASQYLDFLISRIRTFLSDPRVEEIVGGTDLALDQWLSDLLGDDESGGAITILDLSLVPAEIVHVVTAVTARMLFETLQRYRRMTGAVLPTVLVMEEAHTFVKRYRDQTESSDAAAVCCQVFERLAREGRKFGLGLVLSSQRPSELSPTVLSQCNTFLLHRISNDRDQELVHRLVPDNLRGLLRELPSLPSQHAILLGWAFELPVLVRIDGLPRNLRPQSDDPDFWYVWTGSDEAGTAVKRSPAWQTIAKEWQGAANMPTSGQAAED